MDGTPLLLVGGEDHRSGQEADTEAHFAAVEAWARLRFPVVQVEHRWSGQVFESVDGLPYVGRVDGAANVYFASGFGGNGLTLGTAAAIDLAAMILGEHAPESVFRPGRYKPVASAARFLRDNANVAWRVLVERMHSPGGPAMSDIEPGKGCITEVEGKKAAVYRSPAGRLHILSPVCPHAGGIVQWNAAASTWDCPLHGSRFLPTGEVLSGPASQHLCQAESLKPGEERSLSDLLLDYVAKGYTCELLAAKDGRIRCPGCESSGAASDGRIEAFHRFEGDSDPGDNCVLVAIRLPMANGSECRGVMVIGFGPAASPDQNDVLSALEFDTDVRLHESTNPPPSVNPANP